MATNSAGHISATAQQYLDIIDVTRDIIILRDGSTALVLEVNAINFGLLSEPEQDAIIYAYAALINSLSFSIQIVISSRPKDVTAYLEYVDSQYQHAGSDIRRDQIAHYRGFVANLITEQNVLDKKFYVVLPLSALELGLASAANPLNQIVPSNKPVEFDKQYVVERSLNTLIPRRDHMIGQFARLGIKAKQLDTKQLIHVFYTFYNPQTAEGVKTVDTAEYTSPIIQAQGASVFAFQQPATSAAPQAIPAQQPATVVTPPAPQPSGAPTPQPQPQIPAAPLNIPTESPSLTVSPAPTPAASPSLPAQPTTPTIPQESVGGLSGLPAAAAAPGAQAR